MQITTLISRLRNLKNHIGIRRYAANTIWMFMENILRMIAGVLVGIWVARYLGPEKLGIFGYSMAFVSMFSCVSGLGLDSIVVRELVRTPEQRNIYMGTAFWLRIAGAGLAISCIAIANVIAKNDATTTLYIFIIAGGMLFQSFDVINFAFQSEVLSKFVSICKMIQLLISSLFKIYLVLVGADLFWFVLVNLLDCVGLAISMAIAYRCHRNENFYRHFDMSVAKDFLKNSWPLILSGFVIAIYMRSDQIMIKQMMGEKDVGLYSAAVRLSEVWYFIPMIISSSVFPAIINAKKHSNELYLRRMQSFFTMMVWLAIALAVPMTMLSHWIIVLLYGEAYRAAGPVLMIHIWTGILVFFGVAKGQWLLAENMQQYGMVYTACGAASNVILNFIMIPHFGIIGAAMATIVAHLISALVIPIFVKKDRISILMFFRTVDIRNMFRNV